MNSSGRITDPKLLDGHTQKQLTTLVDAINRGYPHLKISKSGNKADLIRRIIATNNLLEACVPINEPTVHSRSSGTPAAQDHEQSAAAAAPCSSKKQEAEPPAVCAAALKRKRVATAKAVYIDLVNRYNSSQLDGYDPRSGRKLLKLSAHGNAETLKERLREAGMIAIPTDIANYVFIGDTKADGGRSSACSSAATTSASDDDGGGVKNDDAAPF